MTDRCSRPRSRRRPERLALRVAAERVAAGAVAAQLAVRGLRDLVVVVDDAVGELAERVRQLRRVVRAVNGRDGLVGALEQAVRDLDRGRAGPQRGERVDEPLGLVVAGDVLARGRVLGDVVGLVVDDQVRAVGLVGVDVDDAADERAEPSGSSAKANQASRVTSRRCARRSHSGESANAVTKARISSTSASLSLAPCVVAEGADAPRHPGRRGRRSRAPRGRGARANPAAGVDPGCDLRLYLRWRWRHVGQSQDPAQVEAVAALRVVGQLRVRQRWGIGRARVGRGRDEGGLAGSAVVTRARAGARPGIERPPPAGPRRASRACSSRRDCMRA